MMAGPKVPGRSEAGKARDPAAAGRCRDAKAHSGREHCVVERGARGHVFAWIERRSSMGPSWTASRCLGPFGRRKPSPVRERERPVFGRGEALLSGLELPLGRAYARCFPGNCRARPRCRHTDDRPSGRCRCGRRGQTLPRAQVPWRPPRAGGPGSSGAHARRRPHLGSHGTSGDIRSSPLLSSGTLGP